MYLIGRKRSPFALAVLALVDHLVEINPGGLRHYRDNSETFAKIDEGFAKLVELLNRHPNRALPRAQYIHNEYWRKPLTRERLDTICDTDLVIAAPRFLVATVQLPVHFADMPVWHTFIERFRRMLDL